MSKRKPTDDYERRKQSRLHKLGTNSPRCANCGNSDWRVIEEHHVAGRQHDNKIVLCANHHRILTDSQKGHPAMEQDSDELLTKIGNFLLGLADMLALIVESLHEFGETLIDRARAATVQMEIVK